MHKQKSVESPATGKKNSRVLGIARPDIAHQWSHKNNVSAHDVGIYSRQNFLWVGTCGHEFDATPKALTANTMPRACYECAPSVHKRKRRKAKLDVSHPDIASELHPAKNNGLLASEVSPGSSKLLWWLGKDCGHEWEARVFSRTNRVASGCPYCSGHKVLCGFNDVATTHPDLLEWWDDSNTEVDMHSISAGSSVVVQWRCPGCSSQWSESVLSMTRKKLRCATCRGGSAGVSAGVNDLRSQRDDLVGQWHPTKNGARTPDNTTVASSYNAWWVCSEDATHEWQAPVYARSRTGGGSGCPHCSARKTSSRGEEDVLRVLSLLGVTNVKTSVRSVTKGELDIYIPEKNLAIEFNGLYWHSDAAGKNSQYHLGKTVAAAQKGVRLVHIWEDDWRDRRDILVRNLAEHLGVTERLGEFGVLIEPNPSLIRKFPVSELTFDVIPYSVSKVFMNENHYQGASSGTLHLGLRDRHRTLRAVLVITRSHVKQREGEWRIERYATRGVVPDGLEKLLALSTDYINSEQLGLLTNWVAYGDRALAEDQLYLSSGFTEDGHTKPQCHYVWRNSRVSKSQYQKILASEPDMKSVILPRIWDSGKTRWVKNI